MSYGFFSSVFCFQFIYKVRHFFFVVYDLSLIHISFPCAKAEAVAAMMSAAERIAFLFLTMFLFINCSCLRHVAGEVVRALYGAGYMESTIGQYRKSIRALERYAGGPDAVYTRGLGAGFAASTFSERTGGFSRQRWFDYGRLARLCDSYLRSGSVDLGKWRRSCLLYTSRCV